MLDVVVPVFNCHDLTLRCVSSVLLSRPPFLANVVVVNDASTEEAPAFFGYLQNAGCMVVHNAQNEGCHRSWNVGFRHTFSENVAFINNDVVLGQHTLERMHEYLRSNLDAPYVGALDVGEAKKFSPRDLLAAEVASTEGVRAGVDFNSCFMVRRQVVEELGGFDDSMKHVFADADFIERMKDRFGPPVVLESAVCYHGRSVSRKRVGLVKDIERMMKDQAIFREKWKDRPDVLAKHPPYSRESALGSTARVWANEGER